MDMFLTEIEIEKAESLLHGDDVWYMRGGGRARAFEVYMLMFLDTKYSLLFTSHALYDIAVIDVDISFNRRFNDRTAEDFRVIRDILNALSEGSWWERMIYSVMDLTWRIGRRPWYVVLKTNVLSWSYNKSTKLLNRVRLARPSSHERI
jgi:hypothetical protein